MPRVWRVEHRETGYGPYQMRKVKDQPHYRSLMDVTRELSRRHDNDPVFHPCWWLDRGHAEVPPSLEHIRFGFESLEKTRTWFGADVEVFHIAPRAFVVREYEVKPSGVWSRKAQCKFDMDRATLVATHELEEVFY